MKKLTPFQKKFRKVFLDGLKSHLKFLEMASRPGVVLTEEQQEQIRSLVQTDETAKAQRIILDELEKQYQERS